MSQADLDDSVNNLGDAGNILLQNFTYGTIGYDKDEGKLKKGFLTHAVDETIGELTGRNMARKELMNQREEVESAATAQKKLLDDERQRQYGQEVKTSNYASMIRDRSFQKYRNSLGTESGASGTRSTFNNKTGA